MNNFDGNLCCDIFSHISHFTTISLVVFLINDISSHFTKFSLISQHFSPIPTFNYYSPQWRWSQGRETSSILRTLEAPQRSSYSTSSSVRSHCDMIMFFFLIYWIPNLTLTHSCQHVTFSHSSLIHSLSNFLTL